jgi:hypothetical protein
MRMIASWTGSGARAKDKRNSPTKEFLPLDSFEFPMLCGSLLYLKLVSEEDSMRLRHWKGIFFGALCLGSAGASLGAEQQTPSTLRKNRSLVGLVLPLTGKSGDFGKSLEAHLQAVLHDLQENQFIELVPMDAAEGADSIFKLVREVVNKKEVSALVGAVGDYEAKSLLMGSLGLPLPVILPEAANQDLLPEGARAVSFVLPFRKQGEILAQWARPRFRRVLLIHSDESSQDLEFALGFEKKILDGFARKPDSLFQRKLYSSRSQKLDWLGGLLKSFNPQLIVLPTQSSAQAAFLLQALAAQGYAQEIVGTRGWLSPESLEARSPIWISKKVLVTGSYESAIDREHPEFRIYREAVLWVNECFSKKEASKVKACLTEWKAKEGYRLSSKKAEIIFRSRSMNLLELSPGGPRHLATLALPQ